MKVSETFTSQLMSNHITRMTQVSIEINGNLHFSQNWHGENFKTLHNTIDVENLLPQMKIFEQINILLFLIHILVQNYMSFCLPKCSWSTDYVNILQLTTVNCVASDQLGMTVYI